MADLLAHETEDSRDKLAYELHHNDGLPLSVIAEEFITDIATVRTWIRKYVARRDAAVAEEQRSLF